MLVVGAFGPPGIAGVIAEAPGEGESGAGTVGDPLEIKEEGIADPEKSPPAGIEDIAGAEGERGLVVGKIVPGAGIEAISWAVPVLQDQLIRFIVRS